MDYVAHLRETAQHLIRMADDPLTSGSKGHAALRLEELQASHPMYEVLPTLIAELRASGSSSPASLSPGSTSGSTGR